jgi:hypothetical protein
MGAVTSWHVQADYDAVQVIACAWKVKPSPSPKVLSQPWVAVSNVPKRRISGETHLRFGAAITRPP